MISLLVVLGLLQLQPVELPKASVRTATNATLVLKVADQNQAAEALIADATKLGGFFSVREDQMIKFKIPQSKTQPFIQKVMALGVLVDRSYQAQDVGARLLELQTRLASREQVFERYFAVLQAANNQDVVAVETSMTKLVQQIEQLKGELRLIEHQLALAEVTVRFQFRDRQPPSSDGTSSFPWLNRMNLTDLLWEFDRD